MTRKMTVILLLSAALALALGLVYYPAHANTLAGTSRGVTLIVFACGQDPNNTQVFGPSAGIGISGGWCDGVGQLNLLQLPGGTLYNLRATVGAGTSDSTPAPLKVMIRTSSSPVPVLVCEASTSTAICQDLVHSGTVNAGDTVSASVSIPDSNTWIAGVTITVEENIIE